jgi:hypothetical protein
MMLVIVGLLLLLLVGLLVWLTRDEAPGDPAAWRGTIVAQVKEPATDALPVPPPKAPVHPQPVPVVVQKPQEPALPPQGSPPPGPVPTTEPTKNQSKSQGDPGGLVMLDHFGNPQSKDAGLFQDGEFKGQRILAYWYPNGESQYLADNNHPLWNSLRKMGFDVTVQTGKFQASWLTGIDQLWLFSSAQADYYLTDDDLAAVAQLVQSGKSLYLLADNDPYTYEANVLGTKLFGTPVLGNYVGQKIGYVAERNLAAEQITQFKGQYTIHDHVLLTGVNFIYEGSTISHFNATPSLDVVSLASDGQPLVGVSRLAGGRVVLDCGFTRYFSDPTGGLDLINQSAGALRFGENVAAYLAGKGKQFHD